MWTPKIFVISDYPHRKILIKVIPYKLILMLLKRRKQEEFLGIPFDDVTVNKAIYIEG